MTHSSTSIASLSPSELKFKLDKLMTTPSNLRYHEYTVEIPTKGPTSNPLTTTKFRTCDRCKKGFEFNPYHPRQSGICEYHNRRKNKRTGVLRYDCCSKKVWDNPKGCKRKAFHVSRTTDDDAERHFLIPFQMTPAPVAGSTGAVAVGLDCEMGYTAYGMECLSISIVDFVSGKTLLECDVKPQGEILDLNGEISGVHSISPSALTLSQLHEKMFKDLKINRDTVIVGHGLENDLCALRLIHHRVADTAIIFVKGTGGVRNKYALKDLASMYLRRSIQSDAHSGDEDAKASVDLIKYKMENDMNY